jgi:hypothetical protein
MIHEHGILKGGERDVGGREWNDMRLRSSGFLCE